MCLYPKLIRNRKYTKNSKNRGVIPPIADPRVLAVPAKCGKCEQCCKEKAREWTVRLQEHIKTNKNGKFITLTLSDKSIAELTEVAKESIEQEKKKIEYTAKNAKDKEIKLRKLAYNSTGYGLDNKIATIAVRRFLERYRKHYKKSIHHWLITELGHKGTENLHLHGILFTDKSYDIIEEIWEYGFIWPRKIKQGNIWVREHTYVNNETIGYCVKYVSKIDKDHKYYKPKLLTSAGIGADYTKRHDSKNNKYNENKTDETYRIGSGHKIALPIYWRNKIYTEEEREKLWIEKLNKQVMWIKGIKFDISKGTQEYMQALEQAQKDSEGLGYMNDKINWERSDYETQRRNYLREKRQKRASGGV